MPDSPADTFRWLISNFDSLVMHKLIPSKAINQRPT